MRVGLVSLPVTITLAAIGLRSAWNLGSHAALPLVYALVALPAVWALMLVWTLVFSQIDRRMSSGYGDGFAMPPGELRRLRALINLGMGGLSLFVFAEVALALLLAVWAVRSAGFASLFVIVYVLPNVFVSGYLWFIGQMAIPDNWM